MPEPIIDDIGSLPQVECSVLYLTHEGVLNADGVVDAAGNIFAGERFQVGNYTRIFVRKYAPDGVTLLGQWAVKGPRGYKIDGFGFCPAGPNLDLIIVAHDTPQDPANRLSASGRARIPGVFVPFGNQLPKAGADNADPQAPQEGEPVDYEEIERRAKFAAKEALNEWVNTWANPERGVRQTLKDLPGDALLYMTDPANKDKEYKTGAYQTVLYEFVRNAAAAVWFNVLRGEPSPGDWNIKRREELKEVFREVLREIDEPTEVQVVED